MEIFICNVTNIIIPALPQIWHKWTPNFKRHQERRDSSEIIYYQERVHFVCISSKAHTCTPQAESLTFRPDMKSGYFSCLDTQTPSSLIIFQTFWLCYVADRRRRRWFWGDGTTNYTQTRTQSLWVFSAGLVSSQKSRTGQDRLGDVWRLPPTSTCNMFVIATNLQSRMGGKLNKTHAHSHN